MSQVPTAVADWRRMEDARSTPLDLAPRLGRGLSVAEKCYADTLLPDGSMVVVYLAWMRVAGVRVARVMSEWFGVDRPPRRGLVPATELEGSGESLSLGPARIQGGRLSWETPGLSGELEFAPRYPAVTMRDPFLAVGPRSIRWTVEVPDADVRGELWWPGGGQEVRGRGYRDRVYCDFLPWSFPLRRLRWGRAVTGSRARVWVAAADARGERTACWENGHVATGECVAADVKEPRTLLDARLGDVVPLPLGPLRPLFRRVIRDPHQRRWVGRTAWQGEQGHAVAEEVRWR